MDSVASNIAHLYRRAGFGIDPSALDAAVSAGYEATVEALLQGAGAPDPAGDAIASPTFAPYEPITGAKGSPEQIAAVRAQNAALRAEFAPLQAWWMNRMIVSSTPLREKMTLLWHGHFATAIRKVRDPHLMFLQNQLFRTAGMGSFADLTQAVAKGGAMMIWLDTQQDKKAHPNENFARELMELFTLGVGNYTQADVEQVARCFTGWAYDRANDQWLLQAAQHDSGTKTLLGRTGNLSGEDAIATILSQQASGPFVAAKVWSHLAYPVAPGDAVVSQLVASFMPSMNVTDLLRAVFNHPAFVSPAAKSGLVKQPIEYVVGAARALKLDADGNRLGSSGPQSGAAGTSPPRANLAAAATVLAQTPFDPPNVGGWPQNSYWLNTSTALSRIRVAESLAAKADLSGVAAVPVSQRVAFLARLLGLADGFAPSTAAALSKVAAEPVNLLALALNSPDYISN